MLSRRASLRDVPTLAHLVHCIEVHVISCFSEKSLTFLEGLHGSKRKPCEEQNLASAASGKARNVFMPPRGASAVLSPVLALQPHFQKHVSSVIEESRRGLVG